MKSTFQNFNGQKIPSNSVLSTLTSSDFAYAKNPTINWHGMLLGPTERMSNKILAIMFFMSYNSSFDNEE